MPGAGDDREHAAARPLGEPARALRDLLVHVGDVEVGDLAAAGEQRRPPRSGWSVWTWIFSVRASPTTSTRVAERARAPAVKRAASSRTAGDGEVRAVAVGRGVVLGVRHAGRRVVLAAAAARRRAARRRCRRRSRPARSRRRRRRPPRAAPLSSSGVRITDASPAATARSSTLAIASSWSRGGRVAGQARARACARARPRRGAPSRARRSGSCPPPARAPTRRRGRPRARAPRRSASGRSARPGRLKSSSAAPRISCERITPLLPRAPSSAARATDSTISSRPISSIVRSSSAARRSSSSSTARSVSTMLSPVSPSATGNTLRSLTSWRRDSRCASAPATSVRKRIRCWGQARPARRPIAALVTLPALRQRVHT